MFRNIVDYNFFKYTGDNFLHNCKQHQAKGNEANMVYVLGIVNIDRKEDDMNMCNELFVALTRAKCWVKVLGLGDYKFYDEFRKVIEAKGSFEFVYRRPRQIVDDVENNKKQELPILAMALSCYGLVLLWPRVS